MGTSGGREDANGLIPLSRAARLFPKRDGKAVHLKTLHRRIRAGSRGVRLRAVHDGGRWYTSPAWVRQFLDESTRAALPAGAIHPNAAAEDHDAACRELHDRWGL
jgi:hypothetical protein